MALVQRRGTTTRPRPADDEDEAPRRPRSAADRVARKRVAAEPKFQEPDPDEEGFEDEDEAPAPRRRAAGADRGSFRKGAEEGSRRRARDEDDEEDDEDTSGAVQSGWGAAKKQKTEGGSFASEMTITNDEQIVVFLEDHPYAVYKQHWIEGLRSTKKRSFICLGKGCPLCALPDSPAKKWAFNVAVWDGSDFEVKSLICGSRLFDNIVDEHEGADGPLNEGIWTLNKSGKKQSTTYKLKRPSGRKLEAAPHKVTEEELLEALEEADLEPYTAEQHKAPSRSYLEEIAEELLDGED